MYFTENEHELNFISLFNIYQRRRKYGETHEAALYIAAIPAIFHLLDQEKLREMADRGITPLLQLAEMDREDLTLLFTDRRLTDVTRAVCQFGMSLHSGHPVEMDDVVAATADSPELVEALVQSIRIRSAV